MHRYVVHHLEFSVLGWFGHIRALLCRLLFLLGLILCCVLSTLLLLLVVTLLMSFIIIFLLFSRRRFLFLGGRLLSSGPEIEDNF